MQAVGRILRRRGVGALGVNSVAKAARSEKVLIYRYFGGLDGLMEAYAARSDFWPSLEELIGPGGEVIQGDDKAAAGARVLANYARALRRRPVTLELLAWETSHRNALTVALERVREERSRELIHALDRAGIPVGNGLTDIGALLAAAINYLAVRGRDLEVFGGLGLKTEEDWARIDGLIATVYAALARAARSGVPRPHDSERPLG